MYEEWISYPDKHAFVLATDHATYANREGWWVSGWKGDAIAVAYVNGRLATLPPTQTTEPVEPIDV